MLHKLKLSDIAKEVGGRLVGQDQLVSDVSTDSREALEQKLFVALVGERFNGHQFAEQVMQQGAVAVLVSEPVAIEPRIEVADTTQAYAQIGRMMRRLFNRPVVAITGSNGKTSVKDWLARVLSEHGQVLKTQSNLNNQIGVPKTLLNLSVADQYAVIEAGTSFPGEIEKLGQTIEADVVVLTNASGSHLLGFGSIHGVAVEKGMLFETAKADATVVLNADDASYGYWLERVGNRAVRSFSFTDPMASLYASDVQESVSGSTTTLQYQGQTYCLVLDRPGKHHIANAMAVALAMTALGFAMIDVIAQLKHPEQVPGRMEVLASKREAVVINDCYNASPKSVEAAMDVLALYAQQTKWMVLGALGELGDQEAAIHYGLGQYAAKLGLEHLITIGPIAAEAAHGFTAIQTSGQQAHPCQTKDDALALLATLNSEHVILVKGSRSAKMEDIVNALKN
ncbi:UDP-N-acetylmuramoyl-tripeptide--D-alanyl-D-alanine ligase [Marinomonas aquimarina]|uniref:UDP-N-acetylmuramoyl-tripeptide--D-alanyl-D-alanine ligase n=1 Tax=Marinomonas aquimarina TaxID=295068 RepID=A0A1A8TJN1_9GAMM|nr:UDP-N-acetylmuramoyl-tripeptide--D-alanyl-D-alanine ligase [Marinomonas aquimarina]SBS33078.1 UDP-N-acetylmuramoyl-tripeptide--D-alanyl-D-alanine ligase [Marinomonas aquimarina]